MWFRERFKNNEKRLFYIIGLIGIVEVFNLTFLPTAPYQLSMIISILLIAFTSYLIGVIYSLNQEQNKAYLTSRHVELVEGIKSVEQKVTETEASLSQQSHLLFEDVSKSLDKVDEKIRTHIDSTYEMMSQKVEVLEDKIITLQNQHRDTLLEDGRNNVEIVRKEIIQQQQDLSKKVSQLAESLIEQMNNLGQKLSNEINQNEKLIIDSVKFEGEDLKGTVVNANEKFANSLEELQQQNERLAENIVSKEIETEKSIIASLKNEGNQITSLIDEAKTQLTSTLSQLRDENNKFNEDILGETSNTENRVVELIKFEGNQLSGLIHATLEQLSSSIEEQTDKSTESILNKTSNSETTLINTFSDLINAYSEQITSSLLEMKDESSKSTQEILNRTDLTEEAVLAFVKNEGQIIGEIITKASDDLSTSVEALKEQSYKLKEDILVKTNQDTMTVLDGMNEGIVKIENELNQKIQTVINESCNGYKQIFTLIQETASLSNGLLAEHNEKLTNQLEVVKRSAKEEINALITNLETKWNDVSARLDLGNRKSDLIFEQTKDTIHTISKAINENDDRNKLDIIDSLNQLVEQSTTKVCDNLSEVNKSYEQALVEMKTEVTGNIEVINEEQTNLKKLIGDAIQKETEKSIAIFDQVSQLNGKLSVVQSETLQTVVKQISEFKSAQDIQKESMEKRISHVNQQISNLEEHFSTSTSKLEQNLAQTLAKVASWHDSETQKADSIFAMVSKVHDLDSNLENATKHLIHQQAAFGQKFDVLSAQVTSINALVKLLRSNEVSEGKQEKVSVEETHKGKLRIEKIKDDENGIVIVNSYEGNVLKNSEMFNSGEKVYSADYDRKGAMVSSKNFDKKGRVVTEMTYYPNGAIKERRERVRKNGKEVTEVSVFNQSGNKIK